MSLITSVTMAGLGCTSESLKRCLDSVSWADKRTVLDTGLSDSCRDILAHYNACTVIREPWTGDFGEMRNKALEAALKCEASWAFMLDADEVAICSDYNSLRKRLIEATEESLLISSSDHSYWLTRLFRLPAKGRHSGVVHEAYNHLDYSHAQINCLHFLGAIKTPEQLRLKHERDLSILKKDLGRIKDTSRTHYYLGQTYKEMGAKADAIIHYLEAAKLSNWEEEKAWSYYQASVLISDHSVDYAIEIAQKGMVVRPDFPEFPWFIARCEFERGRWLWGRHWAEMALGLDPMLQRTGFSYPFAKREGPEQIIRLANSKMGVIPKSKIRSFDLFNTLVTSRTSVDAGETVVENHIPIVENCNKVGPDDVIVSDYYDTIKAQRILTEVCGLPNRLICTPSGKRDGMVWLGFCPDTHLGDNPLTDFTSPRACGIDAQLTDLWKPTLMEQRVGQVGWAMRAARLTTFGPYRDLELFQIEKNYPFVLKIAYELDRRMKTGNYTRLLLCARDMCLVYKAMVKIAPDYPVEYFYGSRITRYRPSQEYVDYAKPLLDGALVADITGTGNSLQYMCDQLGGTPIIAVKFPSQSKTLRLMDGDGFVNEIGNQARHGCLSGWLNGKPVFHNPAQIDWENEPRIAAMHHAFDTCLQFGFEEPTISIEELMWEEQSLNALYSIHSSDCKAAYDLLNSGPLPHPVIQ